MEGHGALIHKFPFNKPSSSFLVTSLPFSSTSIGCTPGIGKVAQLGFAGVTPARFEINTPPVSVCHQVSTIGHFFLPICSSYQCHASSLIGSPTVPNTLKEERSFPLRGSNPKPIRLRMAVGAVYKIFTLCLSTISQNRPASGQVGIPSNISEVAPALNGPYTI